MSSPVNHQLDDLSGLAAPVVVDRILAAAITHEASDLYWLPTGREVEVRWRLDGRQASLARLPRGIGEQCLTHVKVLAQLLTYRTRIAQDGVIRREQDGETHELRIATMPTMHGERITMRLFQQRRQARQLEDLRLPQPCVAALQRLLAQPHGLIVLTGPTGCGKTTTIYAMIRELLRNQQDPASIITIEDPVECLIPGISQSAVAAADEWTYEAALRAALRQDVKTLVIGEMRDRNVAGVVLDAALTGHRIITTYHAGDIAAVYARLLHQGFEPFLVAAAVTGVLTQRLVPSAAGGMLPVAAVLEADAAWREFVCTRPSLSALRQAVAARPLAQLGNHAAAMVADGAIDPAAAALAEMA